MNIPAELLAAALAAGNPAVIKPSENAPLSALALAEAVAGAGFPAGAVSVVVGRGTSAGLWSRIPVSTASGSWAPRPPRRPSWPRQA